MACDSAWSDEDGVLTRRPKIIKLPSGGLLGEAGACDTRDMIALLGRIKHPKNLPTRKQLIELKLDYSGLLVLPSGRIFHVYCDEPESKGDWDCGIFETGETYYAIGSGRPYAFGAMMAGANARTAVMIAAQRDKHTRTPVHVTRLPSLQRPTSSGSRRSPAKS